MGERPFRLRLREQPGGPTGRWLALYAVCGRLWGAVAVTFMATSLVVAVMGPEMVFLRIITLLHCLGIACAICVSCIGTHLARRARWGAELHWVGPDNEKVARDVDIEDVHEALLGLVVVPSSS